MSVQQEVLEANAGYAAIFGAKGKLTIPPARHFTASPRRFQPVPRRWVYPLGADVRQVDAHGQLTLAGTRYFISEALAGEEVACLAYEERCLVRYRHMYVRELHPRRRQSRPLMQAIDGPTA